MTARFGRNKQRAARERIAGLERALACMALSEAEARLQTRRAIAAAESARTDALRQFMASGSFYQHILERMAREAGYGAGKEFESRAKLAMEVAQEVARERASG